MPSAIPYVCNWLWEIFLISFPWGLGGICSTVLVMEEQQGWPIWEGWSLSWAAGDIDSGSTMSLLLHLWPWWSLCWFSFFHFLSSISCPFSNTFSRRCIWLSFWAQPCPTMSLWWLYLAQNSLFSLCRHPAANTLPWTFNTEGKVKCKTCQLSQVSWKQAGNHQMQVYLCYIITSSEAETNSTINSSLQLQFPLNFKTRSSSTCQ